MKEHEQESFDYVVEANLKENIGNYKLSKKFSCGAPVLDKYFISGLKRALKSENVGAVGAVNELGYLFGFCTYTFKDLDGEDVAKVAPQSNLPGTVASVKVSMLAVDKDYQGFGIGIELLMYALENALRVHALIPIEGVYIDAVESAEVFYSKIGFKKLDSTPTSDGCIPMFLPLPDLIEAVNLANES